MSYLAILEQGGLINLLQIRAKNINSLAKPDKIYLNNTNLIYAFDADKPDIGNLRETFFFNQLKTIGEITSGNRGDFIFDNKYIFEIDGKNKGHEQSPP